MSTLIKTQGSNISISGKVVFGGGGNIPPAIDLTNGLRAFYKLNDETDSSGNGNTLTNNNGVTFSSGKIGDAAVFDGDNSKSFTIDNNLGGLTGTGFTVAGWLYNSQSGNTVPFSAGTGDHQGWFLATNADNNIYFLAGSGSWSTFDTIGTFTVGQWYHVALAFDASGNAIYYVNGQQTGTQSGVSWTSGSLYIGRNQADSSSFNGQIDAVGIWNRALNEAEIGELYNSGNGLELN